MKGRESIATLLASKPTEEQIKPFIGVWKGTMGILGEPGHDAKITLAFKDGQASGVLVEHEEGMGDHTTPITYLRVIPNGLEFGFMNGMFPRGVLAHVGHLKNGKLIGEMEFKGIYWKRPADVEPMPHFVFSFAKT